MKNMIFLAIVILSCGRIYCGDNSLPSCAISADESPSELLQLYCEASSVNDSLVVFSGLNGGETIVQGDSLLQKGSNHMIHAGTDLSLGVEGENVEYVKIRSEGTYLVTYSVGVEGEDVSANFVELQVNDTVIPGGQSFPCIVSADDAKSKGIMEATAVFKGHPGDKLKLVSGSSKAMKLAKTSNGNQVRLYVHKLD